MIYLILLLSLILRLVNLNQSFWLDEAAQVIESARPLSQQLNIVSDFHPPLFHLLLHFWMKAGTSEVWIRILPLIFGISSIYLIYKLAQTFGNKTFAYLSAFLLAVSPYHLWYSQEARPYMLFVFLSLASTLMLLKKRWAAYTISLMLTMYSLYFAPFLVLAHLAYIFIFEKKCLKNFLVSIILTGFACLLWIPSFLSQLQVGTNGFFTGWTDVVSVGAVKNIPLTFAKFIFGRGTLENKFIYFLVILPEFMVFTVSVWMLRKNKEGKVLLTLFFVPLLFTLLVSLFLPVVAPQRLIFLLPFFYLIISLGLNILQRKWRVLCLLIVLSTSLAGIIQYYFNPYVAREQWRQAVSYVEKEPAKDKIALFAFPDPFAGYKWYQKGKIAAAGVAPGFLVKDEDLNKITGLVADKNTVYFFQYLTGLTDPRGIIPEELKINNFVLTLTRDFPGVGFVYVFER